MKLKTDAITACFDVTAIRAKDGGYETSLLAREQLSKIIAALELQKKQYDDLSIAYTAMRRSLRSAHREVLEQYTKFLCECGYTDDDVWGEEPTAVERFIAQKEVGKE